MYNLIVITLLVSFLLALWSLYRERGREDLEDMTRQFRKSKIKGTIILNKDKNGKHYSSYS